MSVGTKSVQQIGLAGLAATYTAPTATDGDNFANNGKSVVHVKNASGGSINVTINSVRTCNYGFDHDLVVAVAAGAEKFIGPFPKDRFDNDSGQVNVICSAVTDVTMAVLTM